MLFPGDWFIESTGERSILDQKKVVTEFNRLQADNLRWSKVADERSMQNCALRQENERLRAENTNLRASMDSIRAIVLAARDLEQGSRE